MNSSTIIALATPQGSSGIAVIRLSGNRAFDITEQLFSGKKISEQATHTIHFGRILNGEQMIDEVVVSIFKNPHSYTGEDTVEISCHGSSYIIRQILNLAVEKGARLAKAGEFTQRAFMNGKLDLSQAEAVADIIASENESQHRIAIQQMRGGYSEKIVVDEHFVLKVPSNLNMAAVAPLLCAGITTWSPLRHWNVTKDSKVAVVGLGGLGHMAIKLAKGLGAEVTLFSRSPEKISDAMELGADAVVISSDATQMLAAKGKFDLIIDTVPYVHDLNPYVSTLRTSGTLVLVGYLGVLDDFINTVPFILGRKAVAGSVIGGIAETQELLDFCGKHNIVSDIELIKMQDINLAYERMLKSDVRYRFVVDMSSLRETDV